jgi:hypothetical protein
MWKRDNNGVLHVLALSGGHDSTALAFLLKDREPRPYNYVCTPTGDELPEMFAHWRNLGAAHAECARCEPPRPLSPPPEVLPLSHHPPFFDGDEGLVPRDADMTGKWTCTPNGTWVLAPPPPQDQAWLRKQQITQKEHRT